MALRWKLRVHDSVQKREEEGESEGERDESAGEWENGRGTHVTCTGVVYCFASASFLVLPLFWWQVTAPSLFSFILLCSPDPPPPPPNSCSSVNITYHHGQHPSLSCFLFFSLSCVSKYLRFLPGHSVHLSFFFFLPSSTPPCVFSAFSYPLYLLLVVAFSVPLLNLTVSVRVWKMPIAAVFRE
jgi:hypothetical protein